MVVLVIGIMVGVAAPTYYKSLSKSRVDAAAKRVVADLELVRARAIMKGPTEEEWIRFYPASERYEMLDDPDPDRPDVEYWVDFNETPYPVDLVSVAFTNDQGITSTLTLKYDLYGRARCGSSPIAPLVTGQIVLQSGSYQRIVVIDSVTGLPSIQ